MATPNQGLTPRLNRLNETIGGRAKVNYGLMRFSQIIEQEYDHMARTWIYKGFEACLFIFQAET